MVIASPGMISSSTAEALGSGHDLRLFIKLDQWLASRVEEAGGDEHDKIALDVLVGGRAKESARERDVSQVSGPYLLLSECSR